MSELEKLQEALSYLKHCREERIRDVYRAGVSFRFQASHDHIISSINDLWDLVCDNAETRIRAAIYVEAKRMKEEAEKALR